MLNRKHLTLAAGAALLGTAGMANAALVSNTSQDGNETALTCLFNGASGGPACNDPGWITGGSDLDVNSEAVTSSAWTTGATNLSASRLVLEIAGNSNINRFGIYDLTDTSNRLEIFDGASSAGQAAVIDYAGGGAYSELLSGGSATFGSGANFGFYLSGASDDFYSDAAENPNGSDQMVAYQGNGTRTADFLGTGDSPWLASEWVLAWEDLRYIGSDQDFNDFVVLVESVTDVPAPATLVLLGSGLLIGAGFASRRRRKEA